MSCRTTSASRTECAVIALGSNVGDRRYYLRRAIHELARGVSVVRVSSVHETAPVDAPHGSPPFLNMVIAGTTALEPHRLLDLLNRIETLLGRVRRQPNGPRTIDLDLILYGAHVIRDQRLVVPHPRYRERGFVMAPLRELRLGWVDPNTGRRL